MKETTGCLSIFFPGARFLANFRVENTLVSKNDNPKVLLVVITKHAAGDHWVKCLLSCFLALFTSSDSYR